MRYRKTVVVLITLLMVFTVNTFAKPKKVTRVNVAPLMKVPKGGISSVDQLKTLIGEYQERVKIGLEEAGAGSVFGDFMEQVKTVDIKDTVIPKGQMLEWMLFYSRKKVKVLKDAEWAGKKTLPVYAFTVQSKCKDYHFVIPKACGNVSLINSIDTVAICDMRVIPPKANIGDSITIDLSNSKCAVRYEVTVYYEGKQFDFKKLTDPVWKTSFKKPGNYSFTATAFNASGELSKNECKGKTYINYPPECALQVVPTSAYTGQPFKLDASGSTDKDGKVVEAVFTIVDAKTGQEVDKKTVSDQLVWEKVFDKSGHYKISVKVKDDFGAWCSNVCEGNIEVQKRFYMVAEAGPGVAKGTYSTYAFGRFGFAYLLNPEKLSVVGSVGGNFTLAGKPFKHHFLSNVVLNVHAKSIFFGAGFGYTSDVREGDWPGSFDAVGNIGFDVFKSFNKKGSIFGEIRVPLKSGLDFEHHHQFLLGFRYLF